MKIGILTLPLHINYGGILQAYALQTVLKRMGHEVVTFDSPRYIKINVFHVIRKIYLRYVLRRNVNFREIRVNLDAYFTRKYTQSFINKNISRVVVREFSKLLEINYDGIVVGSDQIWRIIYNPRIEDSYLRFAKDWNIRKVVYAASFGTDDWEYSKEQTDTCSRLIQKFNAVSLREDSGIHLCKQYLGYDNAVHVLDPTMLLEAKDYMKFVNSSNKRSSGILFYYILDETEEKDSIINWVASRNNLKKVKVDLEEPNGTKIHKKNVQPPVEQWLKMFVDAEYVITDSFHGCVFSIIFNKPFWAISNDGRGKARFSSLLKLFDLEDRMIPEKVNLENFDFFRRIDWSSVNRIRKEWQKKSLEFLITNLPLI